MVGNGMAGHKFCEKFIKYNLHKKYDLFIYGEEQHPAYDRINLSSSLCDGGFDKLYLASLPWYSEKKITFRKGEKITHIRPASKEITASSGQTDTYDKLILATGSSPFVPNIESIGLKGVFVYRNIADLQNIKAYLPDCRRAIIAGGGILGMEAARALLSENIDVTVVEIASRVMARQLDETASAMLLRQMQDLGINILLNKRIKSLQGDNKLNRVLFDDGDIIETDLIIFSAGIIPRDELAREAGLKIGPTGGVIVNDQTLTSDPNIYAIGECALMQNKIWGFAPPCYEMADVLAARLSGIFKVFLGDVQYSKLKIMEVELFTLGDSAIHDDSLLTFTQIDNERNIYRKVLISRDGKKLVGAILMGDISGYAHLLQILRNRGRITEQPEQVIKRLHDKNASIIDTFPDSTRICFCEEITKAELLTAIKQHNVSSISELKKFSKAGSGCESCICVVEELLNEYLLKENVQNQFSEKSL